MPLFSPGRRQNHVGLTELINCPQAAELGLEGNPDTGFQDLGLFYSALCDVPKAMWGRARTQVF